MLIENAVYKQDITRILDCNFINCSRFKNKRFLITGGTGLIGSMLTSSLLLADQKFGWDLSITLVVRNQEKACSVFGSLTEKLNIVCASVEEFRQFDQDVDYVIHAASQTASRSFVDTPVETFKTAINGTMNLLEIAKNCHAQKFVFLSTMEVYGAPTDDTKISENTELRVLSSNVRSCYPIGKIACENLCCDYANEYDLPTAILRLTQTFGPGVDYHDGRVFSEFARCVVENRDIVLKTKGETKRSYLYTADAVTAIMAVLQTDDSIFEIYNAANEETYCSIYEMAQAVAHSCAEDKIQVRIEEQDVTKLGYAATLHMNLDTSKLLKLNWKSSLSLVDMFHNMIKFMMQSERKG